MIKIDKMYAYISNQGYVLELSDKALKVPMLEGYKTGIESISPGIRLVAEDLNNLNTCIQIMEVARFNKIETLITSINIENSKAYTLNLASEKKIVYFGDESKINQKIALIAKVIEEEKGKNGEIFFKDEKIDRVIFREKV